jgi:iron-sulfur cluster assembly accessory protein
MDCGTCESASPITLEKPKIVAVNLTITDNAQLMLADAGLGYEEEDMKLLIGVLSGGCSGYMYDLQIVEDAEDCQDLFLPCDGVPMGGFHVLVPNVVSHLLDGIEIDYEDKLMGGGFKINNPNAQSSCGCGESFA